MDKALILDNVEMEPMLGCWIWIGRPMNSMSPDNMNYGTIRVGSTVWQAHRLAWATFRGPIPAGKLILHRCDVKLCCNPEHLYVGTDKDNMRDMQNRRHLVPSSPWSASWRHGAARRLSLETEFSHEDCWNVLQRFRDMEYAARRTLFSASRLNLHPRDITRDMWIDD